MEHKYNASWNAQIHFNTGQPLNQLPLGHHTLHVPVHECTWPCSLTKTLSTYDYGRVLGGRVEGCCVAPKWPSDWLIGGRYAYNEQMSQQLMLIFKRLYLKTTALKYLDSGSTH